MVSGFPHAVKSVTNENLFVGSKEKLLLRLKLLFVILTCDKNYRCSPNTLHHMCENVQSCRSESIWVIIVQRKVKQKQNKKTLLMALSQESIGFFISYTFCVQSISALGLKLFQLQRKSCKNSFDPDLQGNDLKIYSYFISYTSCVQNI